MLFVLAILVSIGLHELGHILGLSHSGEYRDVMAPYYEPAKVQLARGDKARRPGIFADGRPATAPPKRVPFGPGF